MTATCEGNKDLAAHRMVSIGQCSHGGAALLHASVCSDCGAIAHKSVGFACARGRAALQAAPRTVENCAGMRSKAEAAAAVAREDDPS